MDLLFVAFFYGLFVSLTLWKVLPSCLNVKFNAGYGTAAATTAALFAAQIACLVAIFHFGMSQASLFLVGHETAAWMTFAGLFWLVTTGMLRFCALVSEGKLEVHGFFTSFASGAILAVVSLAVIIGVGYFLS